MRLTRGFSKTRMQQLTLNLNLNLNLKRLRYRLPDLAQWQTYVGTPRKDMEREAAMLLATDLRD